MTYAFFLLLFIILPIVLLLAAVRVQHTSIHRRPSFHLSLVCLIAFVYTTPWDNYLVKNGIWFYEADRVLAKIGYVPIEEYCFFILQPILTGLWMIFVLNKNILFTPEKTKSMHATIVQGIIITGFLFGIALLINGSESGTYYYLITTWALPIISILFLLIQRRMTLRLLPFLLLVGPPTLYLWIADRYAIANDIWTIAEPTSFEIYLAGLPVEEALFFLVTNLLVILGFLLFEHGETIFKRA